MKRCRARTEVYSRVCGYFSPVQSWNPGKRAEFLDRLTYPLRVLTFRGRCDLRTTLSRNPRRG